MTADAIDILAEVSPGETRIALVDQRGRLVELRIERIDRPSLVDGIYRGRVRRVEPGLDGAFVDFGAGVEGFLRRYKGLHEGQAITVQVSRDSAGSKGPALSDRIALPGRYLVWTPSRPGIGYSARLGAGRDRARLESVMPAILQAGEGVSVRAAAACVDDAVIAMEAERLRAAWRDLEEAVPGAAVPGTLLAAPSLLVRTLRDGDEGDVVIDDRIALREVQALVDDRMPDRQGRVHLHSDTVPIFDAQDVADAIDGVCDRVVTLPGGARLTFDTTEALTAIDVDSGAGGHGSSDGASLKTNLAVLPEVARQIRLRNISGLIVVDFISVKRKDARAQFLQAVRQAFRHDPLQVDVLDLTVAGLVELTRRRMAAPLHDQLRRPVAAAPASEAVACAVLRAAQRLRGPGVPCATVAPEVAALLEDGPFAPALAAVNRRLGQTLRFDRSGGAGDWELAMRPGKEAP